MQSGHAMGDVRMRTCMMRLRNELSSLGEIAFAGCEQRASTTEPGACL